MGSRVRDLGVRSPYDKVGDLFHFGRWHRATGADFQLCSA